MARWKACVDFLLSVIELFLSLTVEALQGKMCQNSMPSGRGRSLWAKIRGGKGRSPANILIPLERQLIALRLCHWQFLYKETLQQTFRPVLSKLSKRWQIQVLYPHFVKVRGSVQPWLMACCKACVEFLLSVIGLLFTARRNARIAHRNARIASAVLAMVFPSVCLSVQLSVTCRYRVKTTARSTVQFTPSDSKMCLVL